MPQISRFFGIVIYMFFDDHNPAHFHAKYSEFSAAISISNFEILEGYLPPRALSLVLEWAKIHRNELNEDWNLVSNRLQPHSIRPLE